jgi:hypothetical protein
LGPNFFSVRKTIWWKEENNQIIGKSGAGIRQTPQEKDDIILLYGSINLNIQIAISKSSYEKT